MSFFFFFQAEDGIRDIGVTGVQTCALPIFGPALLMLDTGFLAVFHDRLWQVLVGMFVQGLAIGASFVLMPTMILAAVPAQQTGRSGERRVGKEWRSRWAPVH